jgi:hypothetical protein
MSYRLPLAAFVVAVMPLVPSAHADDAMLPGSPGCGQALADADKVYDESEATLDATGAWDNEAYCAALAHHADTIDATVKVYDQCLPEEGNKADGLAMMSKQANEFRELMIGESCPGT